jgi:hypothetical protein
VYSTFLDLAMFRLDTMDVTEPRMVMYSTVPKMIVTLE